jgi:hypothetical protein
MKRALIVTAALSVLPLAMAAAQSDQPLPPGYAGVRFGPDLLLVNLGTDEVEDVIYGVFL